MVTLVHIWRWHKYITYTLSHQGAYISLYGDTRSHVKVTHIYYIYTVTLGCLQKPSWWHSFTSEGDTHILHIHCHTRVLTEAFMVTLVHIWRWHTYITYTLSHQGAYRSLHGDTRSHLKVTHIYYIYTVTPGCLHKPSWWHSFTSEGDTHILHIHCHTRVLTEAFMVTLVHMWRWHTYITYTLSHQGAYRSLHGDTRSHLKVTHIYYIYTVTPGCLHKPSWLHHSHLKVIHI